MLLCLEIGRRIGIAHIAAWGADVRSGAGAADGAIFALLALLLGFAFNGAAARFDKRRELVAAEANSMGSAWQRIDLLGAELQPALRRLFRDYLDAILASYAVLSPGSDPMRQSAEVARGQEAIWSNAVSACLTPRGEPARVLLIPSLTEMFGAVERERTMRRIHPPMLIFVMIGLLDLAGGVFAGYALANTPTRNWVYYIGIATAIAIATYVIIELEYPRLGWVRIDDMDQELADLRATMD